MGTIVLENTIMVPCVPSVFYAFCVEDRQHYNVPGVEDLTPEFLDCVTNRSWVEKVETPGESIRYSYSVYPIADSTRVTIGVEIKPKGASGFLPGLKAGGYRKREAARLTGIKKSVERTVARGDGRQDFRGEFPRRRPGGESG